MEVAGSGGTFNLCWGVQAGVLCPAGGTGGPMSYVGQAVSGVCQLAAVGWRG